MQAGKKGLFALQELHALGVFRDLTRLKLVRPEDATTAQAGSFGEVKAVRAALECKKADVHYRAQMVFTHPR